MDPSTANDPNPSADAEIAAIQEAIDDREAGDVGIPFAEFDRDFRNLSKS
jgi:hypothetical protein